MVLLNQTLSNFSFKILIQDPPLPPPESKSVESGDNAADGCGT